MAVRSIRWTEPRLLMIDYIGPSEEMISILEHITASHWWFADGDGVIVESGSASV